ncbi:MAG TPA: hypothetical protein VMU18_03825 [Rhodoblastus sp.]|nr:hypothetical protein [Rhodoblastus sp.]
MAPPPKPFGRRNLPQKIVPPPLVAHAPNGLAGTPEPDSRRLRSLAIAIGVFGAATIGGLALVQALRDESCRDRDPNDPNVPACHSGGGGGHGGGGHWYGSSSNSSSERGYAFGGFGATGESGAHSGFFGGLHGGLHGGFLGGFHGGGG